MTTATTPLIDWMDATADLRAQLHAEAYEVALAEITKGKTKTRKHENQAARSASAAVLRKLYTLKEYNGVANPTAGLWDDGADEEPAEDLTDLAAWLAEQTWSEFAQSLAAQYQRKGSLSPKQIAAGKSMRAKTEKSRKERKERKAAERTDIDLTALPSGYYAVPNGETRLKVRVARPTKASRWHGWTFVSDGAEYGQRKNYGKQGPGEDARYSGGIQDELRAILADPFEALSAYGRLTGTCGSCGRLLEDEESVSLGIGPVCRKKW